MKNSKYILYALIGFIIILIAFLTYSFFAKYNSYNNTVNNIDNIENNNDFNFAYYKNYVYALPENTFYNITTDNDIELLHIYNNVDKWGANIRLIDKTKYDDGLFDDYDKLEQFIKNNTNNEIKNRKEDEKYVSFESYGKDNSYLYAFMPAYDNYEYEIMLYDGDDKSMNYNALGIIAEILKFKLDKETLIQ